MGKGGCDCDAAGPARSCWKKVLGLSSIWSQTGAQGGQKKIKHPEGRSLWRCPGGGIVQYKHNRSDFNRAAFWTRSRWNWSGLG